MMVPKPTNCMLPSGVGFVTEHIHYGIYTRPDEPIHDASLSTVKTIAQTMKKIDQNLRVIDLGAGYGGVCNGS